MSTIAKTRKCLLTRLAAASLALADALSPALAQQPKPDLADLSLEELANLQITSVSRRAERLSDAAASIFAITGDDIRRSGATSLPEALRLAPNLQVARVDDDDLIFFVVLHEAIHSPGLEAASSAKHVPVSSATVIA